MTQSIKATWTAEKLSYPKPIMKKGKKRKSSEDTYKGDTYSIK